MTAGCDCTCSAFRHAQEPAYLGVLGVLGTGHHEVALLLQLADELEPDALVRATWMWVMSSRSVSGNKSIADGHRTRPNLTHPVTRAMRVSGVVVTVDGLEAMVVVVVV
jgi:hypothetical protein